MPKQDLGQLSDTSQRRIQSQILRWYRAVLQLWVLVSPPGGSCRRGDSRGRGVLFRGKERGLKGPGPRTQNAGNFLNQLYTRNLEQQWCSFYFGNGNRAGFRNQKELDLALSVFTQETEIGPSLFFPSACVSCKAPCET